MVLLKGFSYFKGINRSIWILFVARIINRMGDFVRFFLALYMTRFLNMDEAATGTIVMLAAAAGMLGGPVSGKLADRVGRKKVLLVAQFLSASFIGVCGFIPASPLLPWFLIISQFFFGCARPVTSAMVNDLAPPEQRQKAFSLLYLGINIGVSVGPIIAGFLFNSYRHWIFWGDAITTFSAALLVLVFVPETKPEKEHLEHESLGENEQYSHKPAVLEFLSRPVLVLYMLAIITVSFVYSQHSFSLPLLLNEIFDEASAPFYAVVMSFNAITVLVFTPLLMPFTNRRKPLFNMTAGTVCYTLGFGALALPFAGKAFFLITTVIWTLGEILLATSSGAFLASHTPVNMRGRFNGIIHLLYGAGGALAPFLSGLLLSFTGLKGLWPIVGVVGIVSTMIYLGINSYDRKTERTGN